MGQVQEKDYISKDESEFTIRTMVKSDAQAILDLAVHFFDIRYSVTTLEEFNQTVESEEHWIDNMFNNDNDLGIVAVVDGNVVGLLDFHQKKLKRMQHSGSFGMSLHTDFRELGIGTILLDTLIDWSKSGSEIEKIMLGVLSTNERAIHLYKSKGFIQEGYYKEDLKNSDGVYVDNVTMAIWVK